MTKTGRHFVNQEKIHKMNTRIVETKEKKYMVNIQ